MSLHRPTSLGKKTPFRFWHQPEPSPLINLISGSPWAIVNGGWVAPLAVEASPDQPDEATNWREADSGDLLASQGKRTPSFEKQKGGGFDLATYVPHCPVPPSRLPISARGF